MPASLISRLPGLPVLVAGDVMLDRFIVGKVSRISPEAPVPVVQFQAEHVRLGGAANVAHNLAALGAQVALVGLVGADAAAARLRGELAATGIDAEGLVDDPRRPTVEKVRIVTDRNQQVARVDYESDSDIDGEVEQQLIDRISRVGRERKGASGLRLSEGDGHEGADGRAAVAQERGSAAARRSEDPASPILREAHRSSRPTSRRPKPQRTAASDPTRRRGVRPSTSGPARSATPCSSREAKPGCGCRVTRAEGAVPAVAREVADVTGAGDTVVATLALALAAGATIVEAAGLANHAAGLVVGKFGPATVTRDELMATF